MRLEELGMLLRDLIHNDIIKGMSAMATGLLTLPWGQLALIVAIIYNLHLIGGWWYDRLGYKERRKRRLREMRKTLDDEQNRKTD